MISIFAAGLLSFISALLVALVTHFLSSNRNRKDELEELRLKAYTDFINAASRLASARRIGHTKDELKDLAVLNDAKTRICVCGDPEIVIKMADFWEKGGTLEKESEIAAFTQLCYSIRKSLGHDDKIWGRVNLSNTLFKLEPSNYSYIKDKS